MRKTVYSFKIGATREELVKEFLERKRLSGLSPTAMEDQTGILRRFFQYYTGELTDASKLRKAVLEYMLDKRADHHNKTLSCLRLFFSMCMEEGVMKDNPCKGIRFKPSATRIVDIDQKTIQELLKLPNRNRFTGLRDYTLMLFMLDSGCRPHEALQIRLKDVQDGFVRVRAEVSKVKKERFLPLSLPVEQAIRKLIRVRHQRWDNSNGYLFCTFSGTRIVTRHMQWRFRQYSEKLGAEVHPYDLRHCFALYYLRNGGNVFSLKALLGHSRLTQTEKYVALVQADIRNDHSKSSPINTLLAEQKRVGKIKK